MLDSCICKNCGKLVTVEVPYDFFLLNEHHNFCCDKCKREISIKKMKKLKEVLK